MNLKHDVQAMREQANIVLVTVCAGLITIQGGIIFYNCTHTCDCKIVTALFDLEFVSYGLLNVSCISGCTMTADH